MGNADCGLIRSLTTTHSPLTTTHGISTQTPNPIDFDRRVGLFVHHRLTGDDQRRLGTHRLARPVCGHDHLLGRRWPVAHPRPDGRVELGPRRAIHAGRVCRLDRLCAPRYVGGCSHPAGLAGRRLCAVARPECGVGVGQCLGRCRPHLAVVGVVIGRGTSLGHVATLPHCHLECRRVCP